MVPTSPDALSVFAPGFMQGRHALITGGGSGIGRATAQLLAHLGGRRAELIEVLRSYLK